MKQLVYKEAGYEYIEEGQGPTLLLLHGLFGALSNWAPTLEHFSRDYRVIVPLMPIYESSKVPASVEGLTQFVTEFVAFKELRNFVIIGNSLGGHIALSYTLAHPQLVRALVLTGSSGLFEAGMGSTMPKRGDYNYVRERVAFTFANPETATPELVDEVFDTINDPRKAIRIIHLARSAQRMNMETDIRRIMQPTLLVWGLNDNITPTYVAHQFKKLIPNAELFFIDNCGHAAMMEQPGRFNRLVDGFLEKLKLIHVNA